MASRRVIQSPPPSSTKGQKTRRIKKELPCELGQREWEEAVKQQVAKSKEIKVLQAAKKDRTKDFTDRILVAQREYNALEKMVDTHTVEKPVECEEVADFDTNRVFLRRSDTGEQFDERAMSSEERAKRSQGSFIDDDK